MKKLIVAAMMVLGTSAAFAGDSDKLKEILKANNYVQAMEMVNAGMAQLTDNAEKAKAYNRVVELALKKVTAEQSAQLENETQKQMGREGNRPVDEKGLYDAVDMAFKAGAEVVKYDNMPNEKGKVKPKFAELPNALYNLRAHLINGGIFYQNQKNDNLAYKFLAKYVDTADEPMFAKFDKAADQNLNEIAYFAAYYAYQNKDYAKAEKYVSYALKNPERAKEAQTIQLAILGDQLKTRQDSVNYVAKLEGLLAQDPDNDAVFSNLASTLSALGMQDKADQLINNKLAKDPKNYTALCIKGQNESIKKNYDAAVEALEAALPLATDDDTKIAVCSSIGQCLFYKAQDRVAAVKGVLSESARQQFGEVYKKAASYLEEAKKMDVLKEKKSLWAYPLYGCYYFLHGSDHAKTRSAATDAGVTM